ncbi:MAG: hypothetical protein R3C14_53995 [Caldilineaceae bacterium]
MSSQKKTKAAAFRLSLMVALGLAVLTGIEYAIALFHAGAAVLLLLGLLKAYFVVNFYMHISRLWATEGGH